MHDWERYRSNAADCLSDAHDACQPGHRNLNLFTAAAWLSLARQDEAIENVIASWNTPKVPEPRMASFIFQGVLGCFRQPFLAPQMLAAFLQDRSFPNLLDQTRAIAGVTRRAASQRAAKFELTRNEPDFSRLQSHDRMRPYPETPAGRTSNSIEQVAR